MFPYHVNDLAVEILARIFESQQEDSPMDDGSALLQLASVCRHWKDVSFGHPQLWTSLRCELPRTDSEGCMTRFVGQLQNWFGRAGPDLPLSLAISFHSWSRGSEKPFSEFLAGCSRWRSLRFDDHRTHQILLYEWMVKIAAAGRRVCASEGREACWPGLRSLEINVQSHDVYYSCDHRLPIRALAPRLQQFTARYLTMPYSSLLQTLDEVPLTHLSDLTLHGIEDDSQSPEFLSQVLDHAPSLENLEVDHCRTQSGTYARSIYLPPVDTTFPTTLRQLQRLSLSSPACFMARLFYNTRLPAIRVLVLEVGLEPEVIPALDDNYRRSEFWPFLSRFSHGFLGFGGISLKEGDEDFEALKRLGPSKVGFLREIMSDL